MRIVQTRSRNLLLALGCLFAMSGCGGTTPTTLENTVVQPPNSGVRAFSTSTYTPTQPLVVGVSVVPQNGSSAYAIEESIPDGWSVSNINEGGVFDPLTGKVKWGIYFDQCPTYFAYTLTPPSGANAPQTIVGVLSVDGVNHTVTGQTTLSP